MEDGKFGFGMYLGGTEFERLRWRNDDGGDRNKKQLKEVVMLGNYNL